MPVREWDEIQEGIFQDMDGEDDWDEEISREIVISIISDYWLEHVSEKRALPQVVDASTGEPIALTVDRYRS